jgi:4-alpha-glucanotransferase
MSRLDELRQIAELAGVHTRHVDALGVAHEADEETLARLIAALGLPTEPGLAAQAVADAAKVGSLGLQPVYFVAAEAEQRELALPQPAPTNGLHWRCLCEDGSQYEGQSEAGALVLSLPSALPLGYHRLVLDAAGSITETQLIVAPPACYLPDGLHPGARSWGVTAQLYGLRSRHDWGIGDLSDLAELSRRVGEFGAATVGLNPLHALFAAEPGHISPYSPSSRVWLNYLYIDVIAVPGFDAVSALMPAATLAAVRASDLIDYRAVASLKRPVLEALFRRFRDDDWEGSRGDAFREFQKHGGAALTEFSMFEALQEHFHGTQGIFSWHDWPAEMHEPNSSEVAGFAAAHRDRIEFFQFLQWEADRQLAAAAEAGADGGLSIGLYRDLAVGVDPHGAEAWADQELIAPGASIGAPPDPLSRAGQNWGLAPINPLALRRRGFEPFIAALRANMRHAGIVRIDHVMSLQRLYWIPRGSPATAGAYINYPFHDLLRLVALESQRSRCAVIGEDLGTVPEGFRETMRAANVLSYRIFAFERRWDGSFISPGEYPALSAASAATHDLATLKGFWLGREIAWRQQLKVYPNPEAEAQELRDRDRARHQLLEALGHAGLIPWERFGEWLPEGREPVYAPEIGEAVHAFLAGSRARLMLVQIEDIVGEIEQANLPGTTNEHPNWRRRLSCFLEALLDGDEIRRLAALVNAKRAQSAARAAQD